MSNISIYKKEPKVEIKSCGSCSNLEWAYGDVNDPEGYVCNGRDYKNEEMERRHLSKLEDEGYRAKSKPKCWMPML